VKVFLFRIEERWGWVLGIDGRAGRFDLDPILSEIAFRFFEVAKTIREQWCVST
jgi:hypothetical protein